jgi:hypothetical protein
MHHPEKFRLFYNQTIQPELRRLDKKRLRLLRLLFFSALLLTGVGAFELYVRELLVTLLLSIPIVLYIIYLGGQVRKFKQEFKPKVVKLILDFIDDGLLFGELKYDAKRKIPLQTFLDSNLFGAKPAEYEGEDFIEGRIGDIEFEMSELRVTEFSRVRERLDRVFKGIFIRAKFLHPPKGMVLTVPRESLPQLSGALKNFVRDGGQTFDGLIRNDAFRKAYATFASKDARISELLPDELMKFILQYRQRTGDIFFSVNGRNMYAAITNEKDILEPKLFQSNVSFDLVREFYDDIYVAVNMVLALDRSH